MHADEEDATSPSVETFLEKRLAGNFVFNKQQREQGKRLRTAEINVEGGERARDVVLGPWPAVCTRPWHISISAHACVVKFVTLFSSQCPTLIQRPTLRRARVGA